MLMRTILSMVALAGAAVACAGDLPGQIDESARPSTRAAASSRAPAAHRVFIRGAVESEDRRTVTLPLYRGTSQGEPVWYVITDASERDAAERLGVNWAPKLANSTEGRGAQRGSGWPESIAFTATVDFAPERCISQGDYGQCAAAPFLPFGPTCFAPGATGKPGYSPLVELEDGTVLNASHIANSSGRADKATVNGDGTVTLHLTEGRALGRIVHYVSLDAGSALGAVVENVTVATELRIPTSPTRATGPSPGTPGGRSTT